MVYRRELQGRHRNDPLLDDCNDKAFEVQRVPEDWDQHMEFKPTHTPDYFGMFLKEGAPVLEQGQPIAFMKGGIVIMPKGSNMGMSQET